MLNIPIKMYLVFGVIAFLFLLYNGYNSSRIERLEAQLAQAREQSADQQQVDDATIEAVDNVAERDRVISEQVVRAVVDVRSAPGTNETLPPDVVNSWRAAISRMRDSAPNGGGAGSSSEVVEDAVSGTGTSDQ